MHKPRPTLGVRQGWILSVALPCPLIGCCHAGVSGSETSSSAASVNATAIDPNATISASPGPGTTGQLAGAAQAAGGPANATAAGPGGGAAGQDISNEGKELAVEEASLT